MLRAVETAALAADAAVVTAFAVAVAVFVAKVVGMEPTPEISIQCENN